MVADMDKESKVKVVICMVVLLLLDGVNLLIVMFSFLHSSISHIELKCQMILPYAQLVNECVYEG